MKGENKMKNMTVNELKEIAKERKIKNWWKMTKEELIEALSNEEAETQEVEEQVEEETAPQEEVVEEQVEETEEAPAKKNQKRLLTYKGKTQSLNAWAKELGVRHQILYYRIVMKGWEVDKAFETPSKKEKVAKA